MHVHWLWAIALARLGNLEGFCKSFDSKFTSVWFVVGYLTTVVGR